MLAVRFFLWCAGLGVSAVPLAVSVYQFPGDWNGVFNLASYAGKEAELLYIGIALGAVCIAEMVELLVLMSAKNELSRVILTTIVLSLSLTGVVFCAVHYGTIITMRDAGLAVPAETLAAAAEITGMFIIAALAGKITVWSR